MDLILEGISLGLFLAILLGPIFVTLIQISIEKGAKAGLVACLGIWVSDIIIIWLSYVFVNQIVEYTQDALFTYWMGLFGGLILIVFGIGAALKKPKLSFNHKSFSANDYLEFWTKGFLVNTVNPFTFIFWIGNMSASVSKSRSSYEIAILFGVVMLMIIFTDSLKVFLAKKIRQKLTVNHVAWFSKIAGVGLIIFGFVLLWRSNVF